MEKSHKIVELITDNSDQQYPKKVISAQVLLSVSSNTTTMSGIQNIEINFDNNIHYIPFESLTEETVTSWLDTNVINQSLNNLEASLTNNTQETLERVVPPWVGVVTGEDMMPGYNDIQQDLNQQANSRPPLPTFEETVSEIVMKILREKSLVQ